jgi:outer membrane protein assembly factor BamD (BamD/ComL family)
MNKPIFLAYLFLITGTMFVFFGCATLKGDFEKARKEDSITSYEEFLSKHPVSEYTTQATSRLEELIWGNAKTENYLDLYERYVSKFPAGRYVREAKSKIEEISYKQALDQNSVQGYKDFINKFSTSDSLPQIRRRLEVIERFNEQIAKANTTDDLQTLMNTYSEFSFAKYIIPRLETALVEELNGKKDLFMIPKIRPVGTGKVKGKICIAGSGSLPVARNMEERLGEGVVLGAIMPIGRGSSVNLTTGQQGIIIRGKKVDFSTAMYSVGAIWKNVPSLIEKEKIDPFYGVAFAPGIRLGALYEGDGNLALDYVEADGTLILFPGGTAGSIHRLVGEIKIGKYVFVGENDVLYPFTFLLQPDGYVYLRGKGKVIDVEGKEIKFGY